MATRGNRPGEREENRPLPPKKPVQQKPTDKARQSQQQRERDKLAGSAVTQAGRSAPAETKPPIQDFSKTDAPKPPLHIFPQTGPVGDLRTKVALQHGFTPEAQRELRKVPIRHQTWNTKPYAEGGQNQYDPNTNEIQLMGDAVRLPVPVAAHEMAHAWWFNRGLNNPGVEEQYRQGSERWRNESNLSSPQTRAWDDVDSMIPGAYTEGGRPTETHARYVEYSPVGAAPRDRGVGEPPYSYSPRAIPGYMQPYFEGLLNEATPAGWRPTTPSLVTPDANGNYGHRYSDRWR